MMTFLVVVLYSLGAVQMRTFAYVAEAAGLYEPPEGFWANVLMGLMVIGWPVAVCIMIYRFFRDYK